MSEAYELVDVAQPAIANAADEASEGEEASN